MTPDLDIYRSAQALVKQHGQDAPIHAAMRADAMLEAGDLDGLAMWKQVLRVIEELQRTAPKLGEAGRVQRLEIASGNTPPRLVNDRPFPSRSRCGARPPRGVDTRP